jgi:hypothetical protein
MNKSKELKQHFEEFNHIPLNIKRTPIQKFYDAVENNDLERVKLLLKNSAV